MTENKRFKNVEEKLDWGTIQYFTYNDKKLTDDEIEDLVNHLLEVSKGLKERNNRQAKQLDNLYTLIEKQDWKTLTGIIQEFQECEEQLQKEWGTYVDE